MSFNLNLNPVPNTNGMPNATTSIAQTIHGGNDPPDSEPSFETYTNNSHHPKPMASNSDCLRLSTHLLHIKIHIIIIIVVVITIPCFLL